MNKTSFQDIDTRVGNTGGMLPSQRRVRLFCVCATALIVLFASPLYQLIRHALKTEIASHILLIPFISIYLWRLARRENSRTPSLEKENQPRAGASLAALAAAIGLASLALYWIFGRSGRIPHNDALSLSTLSFLSLLLAAALSTLGPRALRPHLFAIAFLVFMIPLPLGFVEWLSISLQRTSAEAAFWMISLTGMPVYRDGLDFQFPGLAIRVAEECSGVRSTFVLFITSLLAGQLLLRTPWKKALLAFAIIPIGILRNGFRVTSISWLSVNVDRDIIEGPLHHHGGPFFFGLSLVPLFVLLWWLRRSDFKPESTGASPVSADAPSTLR